jgi:hypothetical protein
MHDADLMIELRDSLEDVHLDTPLTDVMRRGNSMRTRRAVLTALAVLALAAVVSSAAVLSMPTPSGQRHGGPNNETLAAWTVTRTSSDTIAVTVRQLTDFSGLQAELRSYGVPVLITSSMALPPSCTEWHSGDYSTGSVITLTNESGLPNASGVEFSLQPTAIPSGALLWLGLAQTGAPPDSTGPAGPMSVGLFDGTTACAGQGAS